MLGMLREQHCVILIYVYVCMSTHTHTHTRGCLLEMDFCFLFILLKYLNILYLNLLMFQVSVEHSPSEVFFHISATKCWDMVRERVNQEIRRQHYLGRVNLPSLQPPGSLDGLDMFGLTSPKIILVIVHQIPQRQNLGAWLQYLIYFSQECHHIHLV